MLVNVLFSSCIKLINDMFSVVETNKKVELTQNLKCQMCTSLLLVIAINEEGDAKC